VSYANLPNVLTIARILAVPLVVLLFYWSNPWSNPIAAVVFIAAALTDTLDGYLARRYGYTTPLGEFLDPSPTS
jgi:CDP-diacylglycerol--glycerol-3-phosphate 3-phosphatidyltransferase